MNYNSRVLELHGVLELICLAKKLFGRAMPNKPMLATNAGAAMAIGCLNNRTQVNAGPIFVFQKKKGYYDQMGP